MFLVWVLVRITQKMWRKHSRNIYIDVLSVEEISGRWYQLEPKYSGTLDMCPDSVSCLLLALDG
jgi:hypothetical protein